MNTRNGKEVHIFKFIFANIGTYFLIAFISFILIGQGAMGTLEILSSSVLAFVFSVLFKNLLTYQSLFSSRLIYYLEEKNNYLLPCFILIDALITIVLYLKNSEPDMALIVVSFFILISNSFSILSFMVLRKIKNRIKSENYKKYLFAFIKLFCIFCYFILLFFVLMNFIIPTCDIRDTDFSNLHISRSDSLWDILLIFIFSVIAIFIENIAYILMCCYFKLIPDLITEFKKKFLKKYIYELVILFFLSVMFYYYII